MKPTFYMLRGVLRVKAQGFWYTSGGDKGSFGFYPHLKDKQDFPLYPDTQVHGDLRMAAQWALTLEGKEAELSAGDSTWNRLFGRGGNMEAGCLHLGDLILDGQSRQTWSAARFQVKPRIDIDDDTRAVRGKMLAMFEAAWLDDLILEAPIYAGYFTDEAQARRAADLLDAACVLLSGFGAMRSRGFGRGVAEIRWQPVTATAPTPPESLASRHGYYLENLVNMRSKPVCAEQLQLVGCQAMVRADQIRAWFVRTYHQVFQDWPSADEMAGLHFSDLLPVPSRKTLSFYPPMTTLRNEDGITVEDYFNRKPDDNDPEKKERIKKKPLPAGSFVTADGNVHPAVLHCRWRNAMEDSFLTKDEGGLFNQQYLSAGNLLGGEIRIDDPAGEFGRRVGEVLNSFHPVINGTLFASQLAPAPAEADNHGAAHLVTAALPFDPARELLAGENITVGTLRRYAAALGRPRRGRPVVQPGSVLLQECPGSTLAWAGFGRALQMAGKPAAKAPIYQKPEVVAPFSELKIKWQDISRSQAGGLRELLNSGHNAAMIRDYLQHIYQKHQDKDKRSALTLLYGELVQAFQRAEKIDKMEEFRTTIREILNYLKTEIWWRQHRGKTIGGNCES